MLPLSDAVPTIPAETFTYDWQGFGWFLAALFGFALVAFLTACLTDSTKAVASGFVAILAAFAMFASVNVQERKALDAQYETAAEQIENQYDVELDRAAIRGVLGNRSLSAPVGRSNTDLTKLVYGSYSGGNVLLMVAHGKEYVSLDERSPVHDLDSHGDITFPCYDPRIDADPEDEDVSPNTVCDGTLGDTEFNLEDFNFDFDGDGQPDRRYPTTTGGSDDVNGTR